ncbi:hypothetical protein [Streptomyces chartreusis]|uniref:hypothetical protein n=1 Tax=Streptomyces chartreusis TaxID=1969 RepID=UPI003830A75D
MHARTAAIITAALTIALTACSTDGKPLSESAAVMCEEFVKQRLKSPGSAEFPGVTDSDYAKTTVLSDTKPWKYKVVGVVDSQNGFGAKVRLDYVCTVSTKDGDKWTRDDIQLTQR